MVSPWEEEDWRKAEGVRASTKETNAALADRDYTVACSTPSQNLISKCAGYWLWWCSSHHQPEMYCREAKAKL